MPAQGDAFSGFSSASAPSAFIGTATSSHTPNYLGADDSVLHVLLSVGTMVLPQS